MIGYQLTFLGTFDHFGLGFYASRVKHRMTGNWGMRFSLYFLFFELVLIVDMGE
jgi:hypothetical protein